MLGFNLHDQNRMTTVGNTGRLATISLLSVSGDAENTLTRGRLRTKRACTAIVEALAPYIPGGVARYDEEWSPQAFGDNITAWGTPVLLIETGGLATGHEVSELTRLNFVAIMVVLLSLAEDDLVAHDPQIYEGLPENQTDSWSDIVVRGGFVLQPGSTEAFRSDLAFNYLRNGRQAVEDCDQAGTPSQVFLLGDASSHGAGTSVNAYGKVMLAAFEVGVIGLTEKCWLDQNNLARLARMGVGTIYWAVGEHDTVAACLHADTLASRDAPRIVVVADTSGLPAVILSEPPPGPVSTSIGAILEALGVAGAEGASLDSLCVKSADGIFKTARLCKDQPASFLLLSSSPGGQLDFTSSRLISVWLDGYQLA